MATSSEVIQLFLQDARDKNKKFDELLFTDLLNFSREQSEYRSRDFLSSLNFYLEILDNTEKVLFAYMKENQKAQLCFDLKITLMLLLAQQKHEIEYQKTENYKFYERKIQRCMDFLKELDFEYQQKIATAPEQQELMEARPIKYLGLSLGYEFGKKIVDFIDLKTKTIKQFMGSLNEKRLYWVWGSSFVKTAISLLPKDFFQATHASNAIRKPDLYTGCLSWALYYFRFSLNLSLLLKHTLNGPWMSEEEAKTPWYQRFQTQWSQRKFTLLNDSLWGTANLLSFFWLTGNSVLGTCGDVLTIALLVFDISVAIWDFEEQKTAYNKKIKQFDLDIERLTDSVSKLKQQSDDKDKGATKQMEMQINALEREKAKCIRDWQLQKLSLVNNIAYAVGLMLAFVVLTMPFIPIAAPVATLFVIAGAVACLAFTIINNAIKEGIELYKIYHTHKEMKQEYNAKIKLFNKENNTLTESEKKLLFLEIKQLEVNTNYEKQRIACQTANMIFRISLEVLIPAVVFSSLVFLPVGIGIAAIAFSLKIAFIIHSSIGEVFKPKEKKELEFVQEEYEQFCDGLKDTEKEKPNAFFKSAPDLINEQGINSSKDGGNDLPGVP